MESLLLLVPIALTIALLFPGWAIAFVCWLIVRKHLRSTSSAPGFWSKHQTLIFVLLGSFIGAVAIFVFSFLAVDFDMDRHIQENGYWWYVLSRIPVCSIIGGLPAGFGGFLFARLNKILVRKIEERFPLEESL